MKNTYDIATLEKEQQRQHEIDTLNRLPLYMLYELYSGSQYDYLVISDGKITDVRGY